MGKNWLLSALILLLSAGLVNGQSNHLLEPLHAPDIGIDFKNTITETEEVNIMVTGLPYIYAGGGVAIGDINNDKLPDIFFVGNQVTSRLYLNKGDMQFEDVTVLSGVSTKAWCTGAAMVDVNSDGWLDIFVLKTQVPDTSTGGNLLFINQQDGTFKEEAKKYGLDHNGRFLTASFADMDGDGDPDLYLANYPDNTVVGNDLNFDFNGTYERRFGIDLVLENTGKKGFKPASFLEPIASNGFTIGLSTADVNLDGIPDVYAGNDFAERDFLYLSNGKSWDEQLKQRLAHSTFFTMGVDINDLNNDLLPDIVSLDMNPPELEKYKLDFTGFDFDIYTQTRRAYYFQEIRNAVQLQNKDGSFSDMAQVDKIAFTDWSWSALMLDANNDGYKDIFITNGLKKDILNQNLYRYALDSMLKANGLFQHEATLLQTLSFIPSSKLDNYLFFNNNKTSFRQDSSMFTTHPSVSTGAAYADLDMDGDLEVITNDIDTFPIIYRNYSVEGYNQQFIGLVPTIGGVLAIGAKAIVYTDDGVQYQELVTSRGFQSSSQPIMHFGLGGAGSVDSLVLIWPGQKESSVWVKPELNQYYYPDKKDKSVSIRKYDPLSNKAATTIPAEALKLIYPFDLKASGQVNDFKLNPLHMQRYSAHNPAVLVYDVNNDGLDDIIMGQFGKVPLTVLLQNKQGAFTRASMSDELLPGNMYCRKMLMLDVNDDGQKELVISSSNFLYEESDSLAEGENQVNYLQVFSLSVTGNEVTLNPVNGVLPFIGKPLNDMVFVADGKKKGLLWLTGATTHRSFPEAEPGYMLSLNKGSWTTKRVAEWLPELKGVYVQAFSQADYDGDGDDDVYVAAPFQKPMVVVMEGGTPRHIITLDEAKGLWNKIVPLDLDTDGKMDHLQLNLGNNFRFNLKQEEKLVLYHGNFDAGPYKQSIYCIRKEGKDYPIYTYKMFTSRFPGVRKVISDVRQYAVADMTTLFPAVDFSEVQVLEVDGLRTKGYISSMGGHVNPPSVVNYTNLNDALYDADNGKLIFAGNDLYMAPEFGNLDAATLLIQNLSVKKDVIHFDPDIQVINIPGLEATNLKKIKISGVDKLLINTNKGIYLYED